MKCWSIKKQTFNLQLRIYQANAVHTVYELIKLWAALFNLFHFACEFHFTLHRLHKWVLMKKSHFTIKTKPEFFIKASCVQNANRSAKCWQSSTSCFCVILTNCSKQPQRTSAYCKMHKFGRTSAWNLSVQLWSLHCENLSLFQGETEFDGKHSYSRLKTQ